MEDFMSNFAEAFDLEESDTRDLEKCFNEIKEAVEKLFPKVKFKKLNNKAIAPTKGSEYAAGWDLYANIPDMVLRIAPGETVKIKTGLAMEIPENYVGLIFPRSGMATNKGLRLANSVGVVDAGVII